MKPDESSEERPKRPVGFNPLLDAAEAFVTALKATEAGVRNANPAFSHFGTTAILRILEDAGLGKREPGFGVGDIDLMRINEGEPK